MINGDDTEVEAGTTVGALDVLSGVAIRRGVAVAVNGEVVTRAEWDERELKEGDRVEVLRAIGGGC